MEIGLNYITTSVVKDMMSASAMGSGDMNVLATPSMIALMENAAMNAVKPELEHGFTSVGIEMSVNHIKATPIGDTVSAKAVLTEVDGRKLTFSVTASDSEGEIGSGKHVRFIVEREKFLNKIRK